MFFSAYLVMIVLTNGQSVFADELAGGPVTDTEGNRCGTLWWSLDEDGTFTVTGSGPGATYRPAGKDEGDFKCPWNSYRDRIRYVRFHCVFTGEHQFMVCKLYESGRVFRHSLWCDRHERRIFKLYVIETVRSDTGISGYDDVLFRELQVAYQSAGTSVRTA